MSQLEEAIEIILARREGVKGIRGEEDFEEFYLNDLAGRTMGIPSRVENPDPHRPGYGKNPKNFDVIPFEDGSVLLTDYWGDME